MLPGWTAPTTGRICSLPSIASTQKNSSARMKLASGPAETIAIRCLTLFRLNAWLNKLSGTSPSRSSSIFT